MSDILCHSEMRIKEQSGKPQGERRVVFDGIISSGSFDAHFERFGETALKQLARGAREGVKILAEHNSGGQPIGKTIGGRFNAESNEVSSKFYIQRGLSLRSGMNRGGYGNSDDYIAAAEEGTTDNLSIGARVKKETCDYCGEEMKPDPFMQIFGVRMPIDSKGHYPGKTIYVDKDGNEQRKAGEGLTKKLITATIDDTELMEVSVVAFGANPDAQITAELQKAYEDGKLEEQHLAQLNDRYAIKVRDNKLIAGILPVTRGDTMADPIKDADLEEPTDVDKDDDADADDSVDKTQAATPPVTTTPEPEVSTADDADDGDDTFDSIPNMLHNQRAERQMTAHWQGIAAERKSQMASLEKENAVLKQQASSVPQIKADLERAEGVIAEYRRKQDRIDSELAKIKKYDELCNTARDAAMKQFIRAEGGKTRVAKQKEEQARRDLNALKDVDQIISWYDIYFERAEDRHPKQDGATGVESLSEILKKDRSLSQYV